jgi:cyclophilin family peptidyl-prolyl cis-trans isomerase
VVPNFVVQGGAPGGNDYAGTLRFMRDEVRPQAWHVRGAVGMSSRGADQGDGQIFIDLVDLPRLDRGYTVFAYVTKGMELIEAMLDGAKIISVSVK